MRAPEVLVIGDANPDLVLSGDVEPRFGQVEKLVDAADLVLGGSAAIVASGLSRLGVPTALAATVGDDAFGRFVRDELAASGVDTSWIRTDPNVSTAVTVVLSAGDRAILTYPGTLASTGPEVVDADLLTRVRHVHSASMFLQPKARATPAGSVPPRQGRRCDMLAGHQLGSGGTLDRCAAPAGTH
jgi:ribokinase